MLYYLFHELAGINIFRYVTFRLALASVTAWLAGMILAPWLIRFLRERKLGEDTTKTDSAKLAELHRDKKGTPSMGGLLIVSGVLVAGLLWTRLDTAFVLPGLAVIATLGLVGFVDDWIKLFHPERHGLRRRFKLGVELLIAVAIGAYLYTVFEPMRHGTDLAFPFFKNLFLPLGVGFIGLFALVFVGAANAVNLTDGLDGLAAGCVLMASGAFVVITYVVGRIDMSGYLFLTYVAEASELSILVASLVGGTLAFLWYNCHPAEIFMGDTGSLAIGGLLGYAAAVTKHEIVLAVAGGVFVAEAVSVMLQVASCKWRGKRIFLCTPLHHHFQFKGMNEAKIVVRFCIVAVILAVFSLALMKLR